MACCRAKRTSTRRCLRACGSEQGAGSRELFVRRPPLAPPPCPPLAPGPLGLTSEIVARLPADVLRIYGPGSTLADAYPRLQETYCGTISYEVEHIGSHQERVWLRQVIESGEHRKPLTPDDKRRLFSRLTAVETLERFLHRAYLGHKRLPIAGPAPAL